MAGITTSATSGEVTALAGEKGKKKGRRKATSKNQKVSGMAWWICSEPEHRLEQNLEKAKGSGHDELKSCCGFTVGLIFSQAVNP